jgi:O-antigen/teichoic acid export membrane protein
MTNMENKRLGANVRLRYTGLITFLSRIISVFTGFVFITLVTRNLTLDDFGAWQYILLLTSYMTFPQSVVNYWITRYIARELKAAKTGLILSLVFSLIGLGVFLLISPPAADSVNISLNYFLIASFVIPILGTETSLEAIAHGCAPQLAGYGFLIFEITKVISGFITIFYLRTGLFGAIVSLLFSYIAQTMFLFVSLRSHIIGDFDGNMAKKWMKIGWIPLYGGAASFLASLDALIVILLISSSEPMAFWRAASTITGIVGYSSLLASALYPKLLAGGDKRDVETSLNLVLMFAIPSLIGALILAEPLLRILRYEYDVAANILRINALLVFLGSLTTVLNSIVTGTEKADVEETSFRRLLKSRLFLLPTISYVYLAFYLPLVYIITLMLKNTAIESLYVNIPLILNIVAFLFYIPVFIYSYRLAHRVLPFKFPVKHTGKYILASTILAAILILFYPHSTIETVLMVLLSAIIYCGVLFVIDEETRDLAKRIFTSFRF